MNDEKYLYSLSPAQILKYSSSTNIEILSTECSLPQMFCFDSNFSLESQYNETSLFSRSPPPPLTSYELIVNKFIDFVTMVTHCQRRYCSQGGGAMFSCLCYSLYPSIWANFEVRVRMNFGLKLLAYTG